jgi:NAD(P)-dependent dehydrogenase (short-subunit alcohol dehydrogenase family)
LDELIKEKIKIDVFVSNAAVVLLKSRQTKQGLEEMFMVNYLAPFYLINKCIENNIINENGRIVIVASESHRNSKSFDLDLIDGYREYGLNETVAMYGYYKMLLVSFAKTLSEKHPEFVVKSLCPGPVNSKIAREAPQWMTPLLKVVFSAFFRSPEKACEPVVYFSAKNNLSEEFAYLYLMNYKEIDPKTNDDKNGELLWKKSHEIVKTSGFSLQ